MIEAATKKAGELFTIYSVILHFYGVIYVQCLQCNLQCVFLSGSPDSFCVSAPAYRSRLHHAPVSHAIVLHFRRASLFLRSCEALQVAMMHLRLQGYLPRPSA